MRIISGFVLAFVAAVAMTQTPPAALKSIPAPPDVAAAPADAAKTKSGLASKVLAPGAGKERPGSSDIVTVNYTGWTTDGKMFDSSIARGRASTFPLDRVIPGWGEAVQLMVTAEKRRVWIPEDLAYKGKEGRPRGCWFSKSSSSHSPRRRPKLPPM